MNPIFLKDDLERFLREDLGRIDVDSLTPAPLVTADITAEETGVMCGGPLFVRLLRMLTERPEDLVVEQLMPEGATFYPSYPTDVIATVRVHPEVLRHGIRIGLNLMQILSGIATNTKRLVAKVAGTRCQLLDTRKTTPGFRAFEKYAVRIGGGRNHRWNREDGILIKKEDIVIDGGITEAVVKADATRAHLTGIEVEVETFDQFIEASGLPPVTHLLLDNMDPKTVIDCLAANVTRKIIEVSGVTEDTIRAYAETGVPFISTSALIRGAHPTKMRMRIRT